MTTTTYTVSVHRADMTWSIRNVTGWTFDEDGFLTIHGADGSACATFRSWDAVLVKQVAR